ncbi:glycosyltransferase [Aeromonas veronii]|uniref:glycosyltransferase n=1 Tax=Aeromonas veronii TaxID=654 RepID=UPI0031FE3D2A
MSKENDKCTVAVIMSVYHKDDPLALYEALQSLINQTYCCDIFVYIDGLVPDSLNSVLDDFKSTRGVRLFSSENNQGLAVALNYLIDQVMSMNYQFIARMDSDDVCYPNRIAKQIEFLERNNDVDVLGSNCREFGADFALSEKSLPKSHEQLIDFSIVRCPFIHPTVMFRSRVFSDKSIRYPTDTALTEDMALWFLLLVNDFKFANLSETLLDYRLNEATLSRRRGFAKSMSEVKMRFHYMGRLKRYSLRNIAGVLTRLVFHVMPISLVRLAYRHMR